MARGASSMSVSTDTCAGNGRDSRPPTCLHVAAPWAARGAAASAQLSAADCRADGLDGRRYVLCRGAAVVRPLQRWHTARPWHRIGRLWHSARWLCPARWRAERPHAATPYDAAGRYRAGAARGRAGGHRPARYAHALDTLRHRRAARRLRGPLSARLDGDAAQYPVG